MMKAEQIGLYVHIPFCVKKCTYCDFCSFSDLGTDVRRSYIKALVSEIRSYKREYKIKLNTLFFGGGTPSLLTPEEFFCICNSIYETFDVSANCEFTLEVNPKTLTAEKLSAFTACGVNRISIGMQTIHDNEYKILGRIHNFEDFKNAHSLVRSAGVSNINIDVMYGIPTQTEVAFKKTLESVIAFAPEHISVYGLILEEGTPLYLNRKELEFPSEDAECRMYEMASKVLADNGYSHYEISNYARPGCESKHNLKYWENREYIGVGVAAYSFFENKRYGNTDDLCEYLSPNAEKCICIEDIDSKASAFEYVMLGLRLKKGISLSDYKNMYGTDFLIGREEKITRYAEGGYMSLIDGRLALTERGFYVSNAILAELI